MTPSDIDWLKSILSDIAKRLDGLPCAHHGEALVRLTEEVKAEVVRGDAVEAGIKRTLQMQWGLLLAILLGIIALALGSL